MRRRVRKGQGSAGRHDPDGPDFGAQPLYIQQQNFPTKVLAMRMRDPGGTPSTVNFDPKR